MPSMCSPLEMDLFVASLPRNLHTMSQEPGTVAILSPFAFFEEFSDQSNSGDHIYGAKVGVDFL